MVVVRRNCFSETVVEKVFFPKIVVFGMVC